jgi:hypothetical protein
VIDKGYTPLGLVLGNCVYSMGAMGGLAPALPAAPPLGYAGVRRGGVIGVDLNIEYPHGNEWMEFTAVGTAVKFTGLNNPAMHNQAKVVLDVNKG